MGTPERRFNGIKKNSIEPQRDSAGCRADIMQIRMSASDKNRARGAIDVMSMVTLAGLILLSGLVVSLYTVSVGHLKIRAASQDSVKQATWLAVERLATIYVDDPTFGRVGLCDVVENESLNQRPMTSLNKLYATLRLDQAIAKEANLAYMQQLVVADIARVKQLESKLQTRLYTSIAPSPSDKTNSIYAIANALMESTKTQTESLVDLRVKLGTLEPIRFTSGMPASPSITPPRFIQDGQYQAQVAIPLNGTSSCNFYQLAKQTTFAEPLDFKATSHGVTPSAVLVEATFRTSERNQKIDIVKTRACCAVLGSTLPKSTESVLLVSYPQGMPTTFKRLTDILVAKGKHAGAWQQASDGDVPGTGKLTAATGIETAEMAPKQAFETAFYHWVRALGPAVRPEKIDAMLAYEWKPSENPELNASSEMPPPNSALTKDTGARQFAFINQSGPGEAGQRALKNAFEATHATPLPKSAIPLQVDALGQCNISGRHGYDEKLINDFLEALYNTNLSSAESARVANSVIIRLTGAITEMDRSIQLSTEELNSIQTRLSRSEEVADSEMPLLIRGKNQLRAVIELQRNKRKEYAIVKKRAEVVLDNAAYTAKATFDLCSNITSYAKDGIYRTETPAGFLIGKDLIFSPQAAPVTESEIYKNEDSGEQSSWTSKKFNVMGRTTPGTMVEGVAAKVVRLTVAEAAKPTFLMFDSRQLTGDRTTNVTVLGTSPFTGTGIPKGELVYYAQDALETGTKPAVGWSVLIRDLIANQGSHPLSGSSGFTGGSDLSIGSHPGLAVEIQMRSPVPILPNLPLGNYLVDLSTDSRVSQIPPLPATML